MLNDVINLLELHLRDAVNFQRLGQKEKAEKEMEVVTVALSAMSAMTEATFQLGNDERKFEILLKGKDGFTIVLARIYKH